jgi:class 3 adenylate cyclase
MHFEQIKRRECARRALELSHDHDPKRSLQGSALDRLLRPNDHCTRGSIARDMDLGGGLRSLGLERYEAPFRENEIDEAVLPNLTAEDLKDLERETTATGCYAGRRHNASEPLAVRIGIATGLVLLSGGSLRESALVGDTPNLAARLQTLPEPGTIVVAASTRRLLGHLFRLRDLGRHEVKGIAEPVAAWAVERR